MSEGMEALQGWKNGRVCLCNEPYPRGSIRCNGQRTAKRCRRFRCGDPDTLWRDISNSPFSVADRHEAGHCIGNATESEKQPVQRWRDGSCPHVSDDARVGEVGDYTIAQAEWRVSIPHGHAVVSRPDYSAAVFISNCSPVATQVEEDARSFHYTDGANAEEVDTADIRCGLNGSRSLWFTGAGEGWIQPEEARAALISSPAMFRGNNERLLAWGVEAWGRAHSARGEGIAGCVHCQSAAWCEAEDCASGQGFLRSQTHGVAGCRKGEVCHRGEADGADQAPTGAPAVHESEPRSGGGGIPGRARAWGQDAKVCGNPASRAGGGRGATEAVQDGAVPVSGAGDQSAAASPQPVAFLQRPGRDRTGDQATQGGLCHEQHPDQVFHGQRGVLSVASFGLQRGELVQAAMSANRVSGGNAPDTAEQDTADARATPENTQPATLGDASKRGKRRSLAVCTRTDQAAQGLK